MGKHSKKEKDVKSSRPNCASRSTEPRWLLAVIILALEIRDFRCASRNRIRVVCSTRQHRVICRYERNDDGFVVVSIFGFYEVRTGPSLDITRFRQIWCRLAVIRILRKKQDFPKATHFVNFEGVFCSQRTFWYRKNRLKTFPKTFFIRVEIERTL